MCRGHGPGTSLPAGLTQLSVFNLVKSSIPNFSQIFQPNHQTLEGSFSAVSTPIFASKASFCSVFRNLQDCHTFAPLETQNLHKFLSNFFIFLLKFQQKSRFFSNFHRILHQFQWNFLRISMNDLENVDKSLNFWISDKFWQTFLNCDRISIRILMFKSSNGSVAGRPNLST